MTRPLTSDEINDILSFIKPNPCIALATGLSVASSIYDKLRKQLIVQQVHPEIIPELKRTIMKYYHECMIPPGESVGVLCAQSIGEKQTQTTLNTFHKTGQSEKTMTSGVPRFQELINATKNPNIVNHTIHFTPCVDTLEFARDVVSHNIVYMTLADVVTSVVINMNKSDESWYDAHRILYGDKTYTHCVTVTLDLYKLLKFKLSMNHIANVIRENYDDLECIASPTAHARLDIFADTDNIDMPDEWRDIHSNESLHELYLKNCVKPNIERLHICGIPGINDVFYSKASDGTWFSETNGINSRQIKSSLINYKLLLACPNVDFSKTISSNVWDIYCVLGIEATRQYLIDEFMVIMEGINMCHAKLLADRMTYGGTVSSITRYTKKKENGGPFSKASFEETLDNFLRAAAGGETDCTDGVSASIICGKVSSIGTGMFGLRLNLESLCSSD